MKSEHDIKTMAVALIKLDVSVPPGLEALGRARLEGMQLALAWALDAPLPGTYDAWFKRAVSFYNTESFSE
jgi:hypothetical protein